MAPPSQTQLAWRRRIESGLRIAAPALDIVLAVGDRISRAVDRDGLDASPPAQRVGNPGAQRSVGAGPEARD